MGKHVVIIVSNPRRARSDPDIRVFVETARKNGYKISVIRGDEEFIAVGDFGVSYNPREASILLLRYITTQ